MSNDKIPGIPEEFGEIGSNDDFNLDDLPDIVEESFPKFSNYVEKLFSLTGRRDCASISVNQIIELRKAGRQTAKHDLGDHWLLKLHDDHFQEIAISVSKTKIKRHHAYILTDPNFALFP